MFKTISDLYNPTDIDGTYDPYGDKYTDDLPVVVDLCFTYGLEDDPDIEAVSENSEWFEFEVEQSCLSEMLDDGESKNWVDWCLRQGIAPGQDFTIAIYPPTYRTDYWGEVDINYGDWIIVWTEPLSDDILWRTWLGSFAALKILKQVNIQKRC